MEEPRAAPPFSEGKPASDLRRLISLELFFRRQKMRLKWGGQHGRGSEAGPVGALVLFFVMIG